MRIVGHARDVATIGPRRRVDEVGERSAAFAEHAHRYHLADPVDAGDSIIVVGQRRDCAGHVGAVPGAVLAGTTRKVAARNIRVVDPVTGVGGIGVTAARGAGEGAKRRVAVVGGGRIGDHIVATLIATREIGMRKNAGVENGNIDAVRSRRQVPCGRQIDAAHVNGRPKRRRLVVPLLRIARVVWYQRREHPAVGIGIFDGRVGLESERERAGLGEGNALEQA